MPTGYTADVADGKIATFSDFVWRCARGMMPLITMRDEPSDAPIPERFEVSDYHKEGEATGRARLAEVLAWGHLEREAAAEKAYLGALSCYRQRQEDILTENERYQAMLVQVRAWIPPTPDHIEFERFMVEQLQGSICNYTPDKPERLSGADYKVQETDSAKRDIEYHTEQYAKEVERVAWRNDWIQALRESLDTNETA